MTNTSRTRVSDRFNAITPSATLAVDAKAKALKAAGRPVIGFGAGEPDFATPDYIVEAAVKAARNPAMHRYTPEELTVIGQWALEHGIWVISDEIYEHLLYEDAQTAHIVKLVPELADQAVILNGVAKTYAMTGWRVGWMIGPSDVIKAALSFQSHLTSNVNNVAQEAARAAVSGSLEAVDEMRVAFDRRRRLIVDMLRQIDGFDVPTPKGAFYVYPSVERLLGREIRGRVANTSGELADLILDEVEVAAVPGEAFGPSGFLRFSYALADDDLVEGITRVQELFA